MITGKRMTILTKKDLNTWKLTIHLILLIQVADPLPIPSKVHGEHSKSPFQSTELKSLYDTDFSQYCVRKKYIHGSDDLFLEFMKLIKRIYNPETRKQKLISKESTISSSIEIKEYYKTLQILIALQSHWILVWTTSCKWMLHG